MNQLQTIATAKVNTVGDGDQNLEGDITNILNNIILVLGLVTVVVIVLGGIQYITSTGDPGKTKKAKDTILYGVIGLIICVLAFTIVNFVISHILNNNTNNDDKSSLIITAEKDLAFLSK